MPYIYTSLNICTQELLFSCVVNFSKGKRNCYKHHDHVKTVLNRKRERVLFIADLSSLSSQKGNKTRGEAKRVESDDRHKSEGRSEATRGCGVGGWLVSHKYHSAKLST